MSWTPFIANLVAELLRRLRRNLSWEEAVATALLSRSSSHASPAPQAPPLSSLPCPRAALAAPDNGLPKCCPRRVPRLRRIALLRTPSAHYADRPPPSRGRRSTCTRPAAGPARARDNTSTRCKP